MKKFVFGIIVIAAGAFLLLFNMDLLSDSYRHIIFSWQMLLIAIGLVNIFSWKDRFVGGILIAVGGFFLLPDIIDFQFNFIKLFWPVLLIFIGIMILSTGFQNKIWKRRTGSSKHEDGFLEETCIFGGSQQIIDKHVFKGGKLTYIFGGSEIDLSQVELQEGNNQLEITCIFGGVSIIVPNNWIVKNKVTSILGGFGDKRRITQIEKDPNKVLTITGAAIFGGGEIKSY